MSAADLFKDPFDAEFRLKGTYIMIGRQAYLVKSVVSNGPDPAKAWLCMHDIKGDEVNVILGRLPLQTMVACPSGYWEGYWYARGPARHRYQGITGQTFWCVMPNGMIETGGVGDCRKLLKELPLQPKTRRPGKRPSGVLTRDVMIDVGGQVLVRGRCRGTYIGENLIKPSSELTLLTQVLLGNAKLGVINTPTEAMAKEIDNPCSEIIL